GLDFAAARRFAANEVQWLEGGTARGQRLAEAQCLVSVDFTQGRDGDCDAEAELEILQDGLCHGLLTWIRFRLGDAWLATDPQEPGKRGKALTLCRRRSAGGDWTWRGSAQAGTRCHSSFLARLDNRQRLQATLATGPARGDTTPA